MLTKQEKHDFVINNIVCPVSKPKREFAKQATHGGTFNYETNWRRLNSSSTFLYNKSVIQLTKLGYNIVYNRVNHAEQCYSITMSNGKQKIKAMLPLASITDESNIKKRTCIKSKKCVSYIDTAVIPGNNHIMVTKKLAKALKLS